MNKKTIVFHWIVFYVLMMEKAYFNAASSSASADSTSTSTQLVSTPEGTMQLINSCKNGQCITTQIFPNGTMTTTNSTQNPADLLAVQQQTMETIAKQQEANNAMFNEISRRNLERQEEIRQRMFQGMGRPFRK